MPATFGIVDHDDVVRLHVDAAHRKIHRAENDALRLAVGVALDEHLVVLVAVEMALPDVVLRRRQR